jgi:hypothetical protein
MDILLTLPCFKTSSVYSWAVRSVIPKRVRVKSDGVLVDASSGSWTRSEVRNDCDLK